jgi:hypothetical protein
MAIHHKKLASALVKYQPMLDENKSKEEVIEALNADDKDYSDDEKLEILNALYPDPTGTPPAKKNKENKGSYIVKEQFRDKGNFNTLYTPGTEVNHFDKDRLQSLVDRGLVEIK